MLRIPRSFWLSCLVTVCLVALNSKLFAAATEKILYNFQIGATGADNGTVQPLLLDSAGNLYGVAGMPSPTPYGSEIFQLVPNTDGTWTENILYLFPQLYAWPTSALVMDSAGNLYGASGTGGKGSCFTWATGCGYIFEMTKAGSTWNPPKPIYYFDGTTGTLPNELTFGPDGNLYGTADYGGMTNAQSCDQSTCGSVYRLIKQSNGSWKFQLIHLFSGEADGGNPNGAGFLAFDGTGNVFGGSQDAAVGNGLVYEFHQSGSAWKEKVIRNNFTGSNGHDPEQVVFDSAGNLYGTTDSGGKTNNGTVFKLTPTTSGQWSETILYEFQGGSDGCQPSGALVLDSLGNLYGTTFGCINNPNGTVWELSPGSGGWTETVLHAFTGGTSDGEAPVGGVIMDSAGNLYGGTANGGTTGDGVIYEIIP